MSTWAAEVGGCWLGRCRQVGRGHCSTQASLSPVPHSDKLYWTHGYVLISKEVEDCVPVFLKHIAHDVYVCGKTINLLKLCCPRVRRVHGPVLALPSSCPSGSCGHAGPQELGPDLSSLCPPESPVSSSVECLGLKDRRGRRHLRDQ